MPLRVQPLHPALLSGYTNNLYLGLGILGQQYTMSIHGRPAYSLILSEACLHHRRRVWWPIAVFVTGQLADDLLNKGYVISRLRLAPRIKSEKPALLTTGHCSNRTSSYGRLFIHDVILFHNKITQGWVAGDCFYQRTRLGNCCRRLHPQKGEDLPPRFPLR